MNFTPKTFFFIFSPKIPYLDNAVFAFVDEFALVLSEFPPEKEDDVFALLREQLDDSVRELVPSEIGVRVGFVCSGNECMKI